MTYAQQASTSLDTPPPSRAEIESLKQFYVFREPREVLGFLDKHPFLVPLLQEAPDRIRQYFPDSPLVLKTAPDPEYDDEQLAICIDTDITDPEKAIDTLEQIDDWWLDASAQARGKMLIVLHP